MPKLLLVVLVVVALCSCVASAVGLARTHRPDPAADAVHAQDLDRDSGGTAPVPSAPGVRAAAVLASWDLARAEAWERGDVRRLADLYAPGSAAGRRDRAMLEAWTARGLVVRGLRTQLLAVRELHHTTRRWVLRVTDRVVGGTAVGHGLRQPLPRDGATTRTVSLRRLHGRWRVESVVPTR